MRLHSFDILGFTLTDDATGKEVKDVCWVDRDALEYAVLSQPMRYDISSFEIAKDVIKVTKMTIDYQRLEIHFNEAPAAVVVDKRKPCEDCCQESTCRRIHTCVAHHAAFGEAIAP